MKSNKTKQILKNIFYPIIALGLVLALWAIIAAIEKKPVIIPQLDDIFNSLFNLMSTNKFWVAIGNTLLTTVCTFLLSTCLALIISIICALWKPLANIMKPICTILRSAPTMAVIILAMFWLDYEDVPIFIGFLIAFPLLYSLFYESLTNVDQDLLDMAKVYKVSKSQQIINIYIPSVLPSMLAAMQSTISLTCKVVIAAEVMAYLRDTIGFNMMLEKIDFEIPNLLAWTIASIILCFLLEFVIGIFKKIAEVEYGYTNKES